MAQAAPDQADTDTPGSGDQPDEDTNVPVHMPGEAPDHKSDNESREGKGGSQ